MTVTKSAPLSPAQRKRAQRRRDRAALLDGDVPIDAVKTWALVEALPALLGAATPLTLAQVLCELGRRGGVTVTAATTPPARGRRGAAPTS